jgi:predicted amidophosphoribosyltransferase
MKIEEANMARLPSTLREDVLRRSRSNYANDPQKEGFCPRCTSTINDRKHNFCGLCGAGLVSALKVEGGQLNSDEPKPENKKVEFSLGNGGIDSHFMKGMLPKF